jgi:hypothetical protein
VACLADTCNLHGAVKLRTLDVKKRPLPNISFYAAVSQLPDEGQKIG